MARAALGRGAHAHRRRRARHGARCDPGRTEPSIAVGAAIGLFILPRANRLGREALRVLLQVAPSEIDADGVRRRLMAVPGVVGVHDLHVWTLTSGLRAASGHLDLAPGEEAAPALERATTVLGEELGIEHVTLQVEVAGSAPHERMVV